MIAVAALLLIALPLFADKAKVYVDATRLAAILQDVQDPNAKLSAEAWKKTAGEAYALSLNIFTGAGTKAAREARAHVKQMRAAADAGNAEEARSHAAQALPFVYEVINASAPK